MKSKAGAAKYFFLAGIGFVLSLLTVVFGTPFLRVLSKAFKPWQYWGLGGLLTVIAAGLIKSAALAGLLASVWLLVGVYGEIEKRGGGWKMASLLSLASSSLALFFGVAASLASFGVTNWERYVFLVKDMFESVQKINPNLKMDATIIAEQTPSILVSLLLMALANALIFEKAIAKAFSVKIEKTASQLKMLELRLPDSVIWIFLFAVLFSMVNFGTPLVSVIGFNLVNIGVVLLFFQGLAVLEVFFKVMKTSVYIRVFTYIIMVGYLFVLLSVLGLIDYWVDFRGRLRRTQTA